jgi:predicted RNase H-like nuclease
LHALDLGQSRLGLRLRLTPAQHDDLVADASGDKLDAVLCMVQAAWALQQHEQGHERYGLPDFDPLEGWIVTA